MHTPPRGQTHTLPPVMRAGVYWWVGLSVFFAVAAIAWVVMRGPFGLPRTGVYRYVPLALGLAPVIVVLPVWLWRTRWIRRAMRSSAGRLCTHCAYSVSGLPDTGVCPECGNCFDLNVDKHLWENVGAPYGGIASPGDAGLPSDRATRP